MAVGDVYEVIDVQTLYSQEVLNVYFYHQILLVPLTGGALNTSSVLADEWQSQVLPKVTAIQAGGLTHQGIRVRNLFDETDSFEKLINVAGGFSDNSADTAFDAYGLQMQPQSRAVKVGHKRIGGVSDQKVVGGIVNDTTALANGQALATQLASNITIGAIILQDAWEPTIVKRVRSGTKPNYKYRLPTAAGEAVFSKVIGALFDVLITTQVSRKIGRGA